MLLLRSLGGTLDALGMDATGNQADIDENSWSSTALEAGGCFCKLAGALGLPAGTLDGSAGHRDVMSLRSQVGGRLTIGFRSAQNQTVIKKPSGHSN